MSKLEEILLNLDLSGLDFKSVQEWMDYLSEKNAENCVDRHRLMQFCDEQGHKATDPISGTEFSTLLEKFYLAHLA